MPLIGLVTADFVVITQDDGYLDRAIPRMFKQDEAGRRAIRTTDLKSCDGHRTIRDIRTSLAADERKVIEEVKLLVRTRWLGFASGEDDFHRWIEE